MRKVLQKAAGFQGPKEHGHRDVLVNALYMLDEEAVLLFGIARRDETNEDHTLIV
jgi:hypothetical protein